MSWEFKNIPENEFEKLETAIKGKDLATVIYLHDRYDVSKIAMCCCEAETRTELFNEIEFWYYNLRDEH